MEIILREYQRNARYQCNALLNAGRNPLLVMDTGTGKTKTDAMIISDRIKLGKRIYVIVPSREIFKSWMNDLAPLNPGYCNNEGFRGKDRNVYVCMMLSLYNNLSMIPESLWPDEIHSDEAHHSSCDTLESIYDFFGSAQRLGMTATPIRTDGKPLGHLYTDIVSTIDIQQAMESGYLTQYALLSPEEYIDHIPMKGNDYDTDVQAEILGEPKVIGNVIEMYTYVLCGLPCLVACSTYAHAEKVTKMFNDSGWIAEHIHSGLTDSDRDGMTKRISNGKTNILCTVGIGIEGWDCPLLYGLIWLRRTKSVTIWKQFNGRVMRLADGKKQCVIIDPVGNAVIHGMPDRVFNWSLTKPGEEIEQDEKIPFQKCWSCGVYNAPENIECHWCGADLSEDRERDMTCGTCKHFIEDRNDPLCPCAKMCFSMQWLLQNGCEYWEHKGRKLPAMIDGKMVAITSDGEIQEIKARAEKIKEEQREEMKREKEKKETAEEIPAVEKRRMLRSGLFASSSRRELFKESLEGMR